MILKYCQRRFKLTFFYILNYWCVAWQGKLLSSHSVDAELAQKTGGNLEIDGPIEEEWEGNYVNCLQTKNFAGIVSNRIIVTLSEIPQSHLRS